MRTLLAALMLALSWPAQAQEFTVGSIVVEQPWARATAPGAAAGAAYLVLNSTGMVADLLVGGATPVAERVELHTHMMDGGIMRMRQVEGIEVAPGTPTVLEPGGLHIMLMGLEAGLVEGESFPLTLSFEAAGEVTVDVQVRAITSTGSHGSAHDPMN